MMPDRRGGSTVTNNMKTVDHHQIDFYDFKSHADLGSSTGEGSSAWGWTSSTGREFAAIAQADGAAFVEVDSEGKLVRLGLPQPSINNVQSLACMNISSS